MYIHSDLYRGEYRLPDFYKVFDANLIANSQKCRSRSPQIIKFETPQNDITMSNLFRGKNYV